MKTAKPFVTFFTESERNKHKNAVKNKKILNGIFPLRYKKEKARVTSSAKLKVYCVFYINFSSTCTDYPQRRNGKKIAAIVTMGYLNSIKYIKKIIPLLQLLYMQFISGT